MGEKKRKVKYTTIGLGVGAMLFAILSARLGISYLAFGVVSCAVAAAVLCAWGRLDKRATPYLVFLLGLAFLYQTTLISNGLVGTDIHTEYYFYRAALDGWDTSIAHAYNTAIGTTVIAPFLTNVFRIPGYWIYKTIFPLLFAFVPVILFLIYRKEFGDKIAFLGTLFFITLPTYTLEMIGLPRQMLGELMLAIVLLLVIVRPVRLKYAVSLVTLAATFAYLFHYITGPALLLYLVGGTAILVFCKRRVFPVRWLLVAIAISSLVGFAYYTNVAGGVAANSLGMTSRATVENIIDDEDSLPPGTDTPIDLPPAEGPSWFARYFGQQEPLIRTALGLDFADASPLGKVFRVLQFGTQLCLLLGCVWLFRNRKRVSAEYIAFTITALALIAACVVLPRFSNIINVTRFYHLALFLVAPLLIAGGLYVFRSLRVFVLVLFVPYILFTTGAVFEVSRETDITRVTMPYSIALSNDRVGIVGTYTSNDLAVRDWAMTCGHKLLATDINGMLLLSEVADPFTYLYTPGHNLTGDMPETAWGYIPQQVSALPPGTFIYLTEWNVQNQTLIFKPNWYDMTDTASGMRQAYPFEFVGLPRDFVEVYRKGDAVLLQSGGTPSLGNPIGLTFQQTWSMATSWDPDGHSQGAETDGTYVWWSSGDLLARSYAADPDWDNPLAIDTHAMTDGTDSEQINGLFLHGDYIYTTSIKLLAPPYRCWIKWYNKNTLAFVDEQEISWPESATIATQEGVQYYDGYWWVVYFDAAWITRYDLDWNHLGNLSLPRQENQIQGFKWFNDQVWVSTTLGGLRIYDWNGSSFALATTIGKPAQITSCQSFGISPDAETLWWADATETHEILHKFSISWVRGI